MHPYFHYIALSMVPSIGSIHTKNLIAYCGSAEAVFSQKKNQLLKIPGIGLYTANNILNAKVCKLAEQEIAFCEKQQIKILPFIDKDFPKRLLHCADSPIVLYVKGDIDLNPSKALAIVGTRKATKIGRDFVKEFIANLKSTEVQIVSGLALGIDAQAHQSALTESLETAGVVAHPLNTIYPANHYKLARQMLENGGGLISEYPSSADILPANFPMRNRIIAGLCDATLIVESAESGGALITAMAANAYHRDVFAVPGRYKDKYSQGCHRLIKEHKAQLIENASDVIEHMAWNIENKKPRKVQRELALILNENEEKIVNALKESDGLETDWLGQTTGLSPGIMANTLLELELKGIIYSLPGSRFALN
ncbi:MAG: DNA processing protein [Chitinophagales bacterium]|jgi:DNA processing protein